MAAVECTNVISVGNAICVFGEYEDVFLYKCYTKIK